jgi:hypothetical protein
LPKIPDKYTCEVTYVTAGQGGGGTYHETHYTDNTRGYLASHDDEKNYDVTFCKNISRYTVTPWVCSLSKVWGCNTEDPPFDNMVWFGPEKADGKDCDVYGEYYNGTVARKIWYEKGTWRPVQFYDVSEETSIKDGLTHYSNCKDSIPDNAFSLPWGEGAANCLVPKPCTGCIGGSKGDCKGAANVCFPATAGVCPPKTIHC